MVNYRYIIWYPLKNYILAHTYYDNILVFVGKKYLTPITGVRRLYKYSTLTTEPGSVEFRESPVFDTWYH